MSDDPYVYPHAELLKNKFDERDEDRFHDLGDRSNPEYLACILHDTIERGAYKEM